MKKSLSKVLLAAGLLAASSLTAFAAEGAWPSKPITLLCGYSAGGSSDLQCRYTAGALEKILGVPVVVQNMPGGSSWICWNNLAAAEPDGYTFALVNLGIVTGQYSKETPRDKNQDSFELLACHVVDPMALCMHTDEKRFTDFKSFVQFAKKNDTIMPSNGMASLNPHATFFKLMNDRYGVDIARVPVNGSKENETMFLSGDTDLFLAAYGDCVNGLKKGSYKVMALFSDKAPADFPETPLIGNVSEVNLTMSTYRGYAYPLGVDKAIVAKMSDALKQAILSDELKSKIHAMNAETYYFDGPEFKKRMVGEIEMRRKIEGLM